MPEGNSDLDSDIPAHIDRARSHVLAFQKEFLLSLGSLLDIACAFLREKRGQSQYDGLLSILREAQGLLFSLARRFPASGENSLESMRSVFSGEISRLKKKRPLSEENAFRLTAFEAVLRILDGGTGLKTPPAAGKKRPGGLKKVTIE